MTYSYTQISQYLTCPRRYRHRYLDGWKEKDTRAAMLFGRAFERALGAYFRREDAAAVLFSEWSECQHQGLQYSKCDSWDRMLQQGIQLLDRFCQDGRIRIREPRGNLQIKQRQEFGRLVENTIGRIEAADFLPHSGVRFPQNSCNGCAYLGLCLGKQNLVEASLVRRPGAENLDWLDELTY
jgi:PD-(D/E)XK nuclease superfamily